MLVLPKKITTTLKLKKNNKQLYQFQFIDVKFYFWADFCKERIDIEQYVAMKWGCVEESIFRILITPIMSRFFTPLDISHNNSGCVGD